MRDQPAPDADRERENPRQRESPDLTSGVPETLSAREAARLLGVHERTVRRAIRGGELAATKQGGSFHIDSDEIERYRERRARPIRRDIRTRLQADALPAPPTSFIGREDVVAEVVALLRRHDVRLLTLTGPGGTGKTRLALRVAANSVARFAGVAFVPLASVHQSNLVLPMIAQVLGVRETEDQPPEARLLGSLRDRELLLVLDNLEQIIDAAPALAALLGATSRLTVLATSRAPLHLAGERVYPVPPLALPSRRTLVAGASDLPPLDQLARTEAVQLFVERATEASADFHLTPGNAPAVAAICERVDGLPLAIELAAARSRVLMPADLLARLSPQLPLLSGGPADQPPRLRSMADAIAWSYDLLSSEEQALFRRLAVFVGGFRLEAAEWVGGVAGAQGEAAASPPQGVSPTAQGVKETDGRLPRAAAPPEGAEQPPPPEAAQRLAPPERSDSPSVLDTLTALVDQSLVQRVPGPGHETRFTMLETVREFGLERLASSGEEASVRDAHADWCIAFAARSEPELAGPRQEVWFDRLEAEHPNLRAALGWLRERRDGERGLRLASKLSWFWSSRGYLREARGWFDRFLGMPTSAATRGEGLLQATTILQWQGDDGRALVFQEEALRIFREIGDQINTAYALRSRASIAIDRGDHEQAATLLAESSEVLLAGGRDWDRPFALYLAGRVAAVAGKSAAAASRFAEAADAFREVGDHSYVAAALARQGAAAIASGDLLAARRAYAAALDLAYERNEPIWVASSLVGAAHLAHAASSPAAAARFLGAAAAIREKIGERVEPDEAIIAALRGALGDDRFTAERQQGMHQPELEAIAEARAILAGSPSRRRSRSTSRARPLTERERAVLRLVVEGLSDKEIAAVLGISRSTASDHVAAIRHKLGTPSRAAASALAVRGGLLSS
jgi:excisionase family DNA binding protein